MTPFNNEVNEISTYTKIKLWWRNEGRYLPSTIKQGIKNLIYWFPTIWKDRNYCHTFIYEVLKHKLKAQAKHIGGKNRFTRSKKDARDMTICVNLLQKLQDDFYEMEYMDYEKTNHWFEDIEDKPGFSTWESKVIWEDYDEYFKKYPLVYKRVMNGEGWASIEGREDDKHFIAMSIGQLNMQRAQDLLFNILRNNITGWWE
jgi:hypothetical protein